MFRYDKIRRIGKGSFGVVTLVKRKTDGMHFVMKEMKIGSVTSYAFVVLNYCCVDRQNKINK